MPAKTNHEDFEGLVNAAIERGAYVSLSYPYRPKAKVATGRTNNIWIDHLRFITRLTKVLAPLLKAIGLRPAGMLRTDPDSLLLPILNLRWTRNRIPAVTAVNEADWAIINDGLNRLRDQLVVRERKLAGAAKDVNPPSDDQNLDPKLVDALFDVLLTLAEHELRFEFPDPTSKATHSTIDLPCRAVIRVEKKGCSAEKTIAGKVTGFDIARNCIFIDGNVAKALGPHEDKSAEGLMRRLNQNYVGECEISDLRYSYRRATPKPKKAD